MTRSDIANDLGLSTETASRKFGRMRIMGATDLYRDDHVQLRGMERLMDLAEGGEPEFRL